MSSYHDELFAKSKSKEILISLSKMLQEGLSGKESYTNAFGGKEKKVDGFSFEKKGKSQMLHIDTDDLFEGVSDDHVSSMLSYLEKLASNMPDNDIDVELSVSCYIDGDCAFSKAKIRNNIVSITSVYNPTMDISYCEECNEEFEEIASIEDYKPGKKLYCPICGNRIILRTENESIDLNHVNTEDREIIPFGKYPQTESGEVRPIEWEVLEKTSEYCILISRYVLDIERCGFEENNNTPWNDSVLRKWLIETFFTNAFTEEERNQLQTFPEEIDSRFELGEDKVSLLSANEVGKYFKTKKQRRCDWTPYVVSRDKIYKNGAPWWTRTSGTVCGRRLVSWNGELDESGMNDYYWGFRPIICKSVHL